MTVTPGRVRQELGLTAEPVTVGICPRKGCGRPVVQPARGRRRTYCRPACRVAAFSAGRSRLDALLSSGSVQWYTPIDLFESLVHEFGTFDLDPCADPRSPIWGRTAARYTVLDDGLSKPWPGRVYCNPPYGAGIGRWLDHAAAEVAAGRASVVVCLVPSRTGPRWWWRAVDQGAEPRYLRGRVQFVTPKGVGTKKRPAPFDSALLIFRGRS